MKQGKFKTDICENTTDKWSGNEGNEQFLPSVVILHEFLDLNEFQSQRLGEIF